MVTRRPYSGVTKIVKGGDRLVVGETEVGVIHVPCHTTGHVVFAVLGKDDKNKNSGGGGGGGGGDDRGSGAALLPLHRVEALFTVGVVHVEIGLNLELERRLVLNG